MGKALRLKLLSGHFCIHKLDADAEIPTSLLKEKFVWIGRTEDELSIVCQDHDLLSKEKSGNWICLQVDDQMPFDIVGIIASISGLLASHQIPLFCISTFDTDYILVQKDHKIKAIYELRKDKHLVIE